MLTLLELLLPEVAAHHRVAVLVDAIGEVLAGQANPSPLPVLKLTCVDVFPIVHDPLANGTDVLMHPMARGQVPSKVSDQLWARSPRRGLGYEPRVRCPQAATARAAIGQNRFP